MPSFKITNKKFGLVGVVVVPFLLVMLGIVWFSFRAMNKETSPPATVRTVDKDMSSPTTNKVTSSPTAVSYTKQEQQIRDLVDRSKSYHVGKSWENISGSNLDLQSFQNPKGEGIVVSAQGGIWVWLVSDNGTIYAVNGNTKTLTPTIEYSSEHPSQLKYFNVESLIKK